MAAFKKHRSARSILRRKGDIRITIEARQLSWATNFRKYVIRSGYPTDFEIK